MAILPALRIGGYGYGFGSLLNRLYARQYNPYAAMGQAALAPINDYIGYLFKQDAQNQQNQAILQRQYSLESQRNADIFQRSKDLALYRQQLGTQQANQFASGLGPYLSQFQTGPSQSVDVADAGLPDMSVPSTSAGFPSLTDTYTPEGFPTDQAAPPDMYPAPKTATDVPAAAPPELPQVTSSAYNLNLPGRPAAQTPQEAFTRLSPAEQQSALGSFFQGGETTRKFATENILDPGALARQRATLGVQKTAMDLLKEKTALETQIATQPGSVDATNAANRLKQVEAELSYRALTDPTFAAQMTKEQRIGTKLMTPEPTVIDKGVAEPALADILRSQGVNPTKATPEQIAAARAQAQKEKIQLAGALGTQKGEEAYTRKNPSLSGQVFDRQGHLLPGTYSQKEIDDHGYLVIKSPTDRQVIGQFGMIVAPFKAMNNAIEKGVLPHASGGFTDAVNAMGNQVVGQANQFSDPDVAKYMAAQQNIVFPLIGLEGGGKRQAIQEIQFRMKANPRLIDTDLSAAAKADQMADIIESRARAAGVELDPEMRTEVERAHQNFARIATRVQGTAGAGAPSLFDRFFGTPKGAASSPSGRTHVQLPDGTTGWIPTNAVDPKTMKVIP